MNNTGAVMVYGATGHTGRFVVEELVRRGHRPVVAARSADRLARLPASWNGLERRAAALDDTSDLRAALGGVEVVVNCAGPFVDTALPLARAAVASGAHYLDVTAEQPAVSALYRDLDAPARAAGVTLVPAMAFYGGLADLLLTAALDGGDGADEAEVAVGLDHWWPTEGTRVTGARNTSVRQMVSEGSLAPVPDPAPTGAWTFPGPLGTQAVVQLPFSEVVTAHRHLRLGTLRSWLGLAPLEELRDATTPAPTAVDDTGRSAQRFAVDVVARQGEEVRRASATGRDIYAVSAPIVAEGAVRLLEGRHHGAGALAPGQAFDAADVLAALERGTDGFEVHCDHGNNSLSLARAVREG